MYNERIMPAAGSPDAVWNCYHLCYAQRLAGIAVFCLPISCSAGMTVPLLDTFANSCNSWFIPLPVPVQTLKKADSLLK